MLRAWLPDMRITAVDRRWGAQMQHYVRNEDEDLPPIDRFNLGQKYFFWAMLFAGLVLLISGVALWFPDRVPAGLRGAAILLHVSAALVTIGAFIIHVYMGTAVVRGGFTSIIRGEVSPAWAKTPSPPLVSSRHRQMTMGRASRVAIPSHRPATVRRRSLVLLCICLLADREDFQWDRPPGLSTCCRNSRVHEDPFAACRSVGQPILAAAAFQAALA